MQALEKVVDDIEGHPLRHVWINGANIHIIDCQLTLWSCTELHQVPCLAWCSWPIYMPCYPLRISSVQEQWLLLPKSPVQKLGMQDETIKLVSRHLGSLLPPTNITASRIAYFTSRQVCWATRFFAFFAIPAPLTECSMQGSQSLERFGEHRGPEGGEGAQRCKVPQCRFISPF